MTELCKRRVPVGEYLRLWVLASLALEEVISSPQYHETALVKAPCKLHRAIEPLAICAKVVRKDKKKSALAAFPKLLPLVLRV